MSITLEVVSQIPVFAVRQPVRGLSVTLNRQDLTSTSQDLVAARIRLRNDGEISVNSRNTTASDPLGFSVYGGNIVRLNQVTSTSSHLRRLAIPRRIGQSFVLPYGLIIDPDDYIQFDLLIVKPVNESVRFRGLGKVEGLRSIVTSLTPPSGSGQGTILSTWSGGPLTQFLRTITYPFIAIACIASIILLFVGISSVVDKRKRKAREEFAKLARSSIEDVNPKLRKLVPLLYSSIGRDRLIELASGKALNDLHLWREGRKRIAQERGKVDTEISDFEAADLIDQALAGSTVGTAAIKDLLGRLGLLEGQGSKIAEPLRDTIQKFLKALESEVSDSRIAKAEPEKEELIHSVIMMDMERDRMAAA